MRLKPIRTPLFHVGEDLFFFFRTACEQAVLAPSPKSIVIISSKVVALAQGRVVNAEKGSMATVVAQETGQFWPTAFPGYFLTITNGICTVNAGIDASNAAPGTLILWPINLQEFVDEFRKKLQETYALKEIGVVVADSRCTPLRAGVSGVALAWSGFLGVTDERGKKDLFGRSLEVTKNAVADNLASAAQLIIGSAAERTPFVICEDAPVQFTDLPQSPEMAVFPLEEDLFARLWKNTISE